MIPFQKIISFHVHCLWKSFPEILGNWEQYPDNCSVITLAYCYTICTFDGGLSIIYSPAPSNVFQ